MKHKFLVFNNFIYFNHFKYDFYVFKVYNKITWYTYS